MTNNEYFNDKPMKEAIAKWRSDCENGYYGDVQDWLGDEFMDFTKGKIVRGRFFSNEEIEEKIRNLESLKVTGFLLEWKNEKTGEWFGSEFEPENGSGTNKHSLGNPVLDDWFNNDIAVGFFKELGEAWLGTSDDWDFRLGVDFDCHRTPEAQPNESNVWEGRTKGGCNTDGEPWRVRKITIDGVLSDKAKAFIRRNPDVEFDYAE